ncbi:hypothetical protein HEP86_01610 [Streptomyces sp. RPA4-5]|uniref:hypothetical protein n=1 Tax=Streptomyces sp. RPA4-5 TaxID=2721245 RepID=UPI00143EE9FC|nr:hypothetical protein [Streptomyces sp. RPA4-5]QIY53444.1 hypothetical protein HEP86_01610 [Streptomyces sp. RPA4-5]
MDRPLLSLRTTLVFLLAVLGGTVVALLSWTAGEGAPQSVLVGLAAAGAAVSFFNRLIVAESERVQAEAVQHEEGRGRG